MICFTITSILYLFNIFILLYILIIANENTNTHSFSFKSLINTLCYSFLPDNYYIDMNGLCRINCSYTRTKQFPHNKPLKCKKDYYQYNKNSNFTNIYVFNTTTYGKYMKKYRLLYRNRNVCIISIYILVNRSFSKS